MTATDRAAAARERPLVGIALIVLAIVVIVVAVDRIPGPSRTAARATSSSTNRRHPGAKIGVVVELPVVGTGSSSTTTSSSTPTSSSVAGSSTTTTVPRRLSGIPAELRARGYVIKLVVNNTNPPPTTKIEYTPRAGSIGAAVAIANILGLGRSVVSRYPGPSSGLPAATNVVVILGKSA